MKIRVGLLKIVVPVSLLLSLVCSFSQACKKTEFGNDVDTSVAALGFINTHAVGLNAQRVKAVYPTGSSVVVETLDKVGVCSAHEFETQTSADCRVKVTLSSKSLVCGAQR